jgi:hypothetical protein
MSLRRGKKRSCPSLWPTDQRATVRRTRWKSGLNTFFSSLHTSNRVSPFQDFFWYAAICCNWIPSQDRGSSSEVLELGRSIAHHVSRFVPESMRLVADQGDDHAVEVEEEHEEVETELDE